MQHFQTLLDTLPAWLGNVLLGVAAIAGGLLLRGLLTKALRYYRSFSDGFIVNSLIRRLRQPLNFFIPVLILVLILPLMTLEPPAHRTATRVLGILATAGFAWVLIRLVYVGEEFVYHSYDLTKDNNIKERKIRTQLQFIRRLAVIGIGLLAVAAILLSFDSVRRIGAGLLTGVGVGGIIVGFAAQRSLANLLAGFQIAFTQPIRIDDVLVVEGEWGRVEEITLTYVVLQIWDQRRLILPINYFIEKPFQNWTRISAEILGTVFIYTDYTLPVSALREELTRLLKASPLWDQRVNTLQVTDSKESTLEIRALMSARNSSDAFDLRCFVREHLVQFIRENYPEALPRTRAELSYADQSLLGSRPDFLPAVADHR
ncbi:mechanosensitive ion channel [Hymenobacter sp. NBH84]|uniref:Mechanosensitive ion channel n=1 Tax=Hymenobacter defluvii TaxID=2054411 RepID=A0ABS3TDR8_9BACT|nr:MULTISPECIES: mechanosensitive ion channel domain-containing protein [Hymenobacter]MBO3271806.1 mechanosensitive ion channel [Hymenobacter defluvii]QNE38669.1 mechanosensitive ion channel [Hymenobacter sp. NBH84]